MRPCVAKSERADGGSAGPATHSGIPVWITSLGNEEGEREVALGSAVRLTKSRNLEFRYAGGGLDVYFVTDLVA